MRRILNNSISLLVVIIVLFLVVPLPKQALDILIVLNIAISIMILMITMSISEALEFSIFPSLLLITTLFRLGLNVSSTRLILSEGGDAGMVIKSFGTLITQGNIVIGILIFLIIVLVQFIVITKGAERVSEVAARFTLDAMPGKQMAIDADLSSGLIDEKEARLRRYKIQKEADFYGRHGRRNQDRQGRRRHVADYYGHQLCGRLNYRHRAGRRRSGYGFEPVFHRHHRRRSGVPAPGPDDLHRYRYDRDPFRVGRQPEQRRAGTV